MESFLPRVSQVTTMADIGSSSQEDVRQQCGLVVDTLAFRDMDQGQSTPARRTQDGTLALSRCDAWLPIGSLAEVAPHPVAASLQRFVF